MGATTLINGVNALSIATDIQFGESSTQYASSNGFSNTPSSVRSDSPSQMSSSTIGHNLPEPQHIAPLEQHIEENVIHTNRYADVSIHLAGFPPIPAHAIFISRSPYLSSLLSNQPPSPPYTINIPGSDPNLTYDALLNTLHCLYSTTSHSIPRVLPDSSTITSYMAASCVLGIYPTELVESYRSILLKSNLTIESIHAFVTFLLSTSQPLDALTTHPGPYPPFTTGLLSDVILYFLNTLPLQLQSSHAALPATANTEEYRSILVPLPFEILKIILEHPKFPVDTEKQRYELAKQVVAKRAAKYGRRRTESSRSGSGNGGPPPMEESVILVVGGKDGGGVQVVRNYSRKRSLWKAVPNGTHPEGRRRNSNTGSN